MSDKNLPFNNEYLLYLKYSFHPLTRRRLSLISSTSKSLEIQKQTFKIANIFNRKPTHFPPHLSLSFLFFLLERQIKEKRKIKENVDECVRTTRFPNPTIMMSNIQIIKGSQRVVLPSFLCLFFVFNCYRNEFCEDINERIFLKSYRQFNNIFKIVIIFL